MRAKLTLLAGVCAGAIAFPAFAQDAAETEDAAAETEIIVTAQRSSQRLQDVPIAVSAFNSESLDRQQIRNTSDLQLTLPNVTFTKTTFTGSSFTIRGVGDLCVGTSCDSATAIHVNGSPVASTRLFESELFDMERVEVLRGPQGTLYGRNATSGVVNFITAKPRLGQFQASAEAEYGNFDYIKVKGMVNVPVGESLALRVAGYYTKRDGFTENLFNNTRIDGRDMYGVRGSLRWEPGPDTKITLMGYYFREDDDRLRIQKQLCARDPTGVLGCRPDILGYDKPNSSSSFTGTLTSRDTYRVLSLPAGGALAAFGLGTLINPTLATDYYGNNPILSDVRQVYSDYTPTYFAKEQQYQAEIDHDFGPVSLQVTGMYQKSEVDSTMDSDQSVVNRNLASFVGGLTAWSAVGTTALHPLNPYVAPAYAAITPGGVAGQLCTSVPNEALTGAFGGSKTCNATPLNYDRSRIKVRSWSLEAIATTDLDGPVNFLVGGIYTDVQSRDSDYHVSGFLIDYASAMLGLAQSSARAALGFQPSFAGSPYFNSNTPEFNLKSYGLFAEAYIQATDKLKLTLGARYSNDEKDLIARQTFFTVYTPYGTSSVGASPYFNGFNSTLSAAAFLKPFDADPSTACTSTATPTGIVTATSGCEAYQVRNVKSDAITGRAVLDFQITPDNLLYLSYSRGYKSGGVNPPLGAQFALIASPTFKPEKIDAFEIGSKNTWGSFTLNATAFYYKYGGMQLSRIVNRNAINDNVNADIYGLELESVLRPSPRWAFNMGFSWLKTKVTGDLLIANPRDPSGGRSDVVVLKDFIEAYNCVIIPNSTTANANLLVNTVNGALTLPGTAPVPGITANGTYGHCGAMEAAIAGNIGLASSGLAPLQAVLSGAAFNGTAVTPGSALNFTYTTGGVRQNIRGKELPGAPNFKWNLGAQYTMPLGGGGMTLSPRVDVIYTGDSYGNIFNGSVNRVKGYEQINAQITLNGDQDRWFLRGFVQNLTDNSAVTGLGVGDQSQGLFTNIFTLEPRRYGIAAGIKF